jgi:hypothetical protein
MTDRRRLIGGIVIAIVIVIGVLAAASTRRPPGGAPDAQPEPSVAASVGNAASGTPDPATSSLEPTAEPSASSPAAPPAPSPKTTPKAEATGDPRLAYAEFLLRANDDRSAVETMNAALTKGVNDQDRPAVRKASVKILDFVDSERDWLREHPPARCYADAHDAANSMLAAYGTAADRFIAWTKAAPGLDSLAAIGRALEAANTAGEALAEFGRALEATVCP